MPIKRQPDASPEPRPKAKAKTGRPCGKGQAAFGPDIVNVQGQLVDTLPCVDVEVNPTHSVAQSTTAKMAQEVVNEAIQAKRFIIGQDMFQGVQSLQPVRCDGLPGYTPADASAILRDGTPDAPVPDAKPKNPSSPV